MKKDSTAVTMCANWKYVSVKSQNRLSVCIGTVLEILMSKQNLQTLLSIYLISSYILIIYFEILFWNPLPWDCWLLMIGWLHHHGLSALPKIKFLWIFFVCLPNTSLSKIMMSNIQILWDIQICENSWGDYTLQTRGNNTTV